MTGADRIEWRRAFPGRALKVVGVCAAAGGLAVVAAWVLFGDEPARSTTYSCDSVGPSSVAVK